MAVQTLPSVDWHGSHTSGTLTQSRLSAGVTATGWSGEVRCRIGPSMLHTRPSRLPTRLTHFSSRLAGLGMMIESDFYATEAGRKHFADQLCVLNQTTPEALAGDDPRGDERVGPLQDVHPVLRPGNGQLRRALRLARLRKLRWAISAGRTPRLCLYSCTSDPARVVCKDFRYDMAKGLRPRRTIKTAMQHELMMFGISQVSCATRTFLYGMIPCDKLHRGALTRAFRVLAEGRPRHGPRRGGSQVPHVEVWRLAQRAHHPSAALPLPRHGTRREDPLPGGRHQGRQRVRVRPRRIRVALLPGAQRARLGALRGCGW